MPLPSSIHQDGAGEERKFHIVQEGSQWCLIAKSTGKNLGCHPTKEQAEAQERAVQANKHMVTVAQMREVCSPCADKMEADGVKYFLLDATKHDLGFAEFESDIADKLREFAIGDSHNIKGVEIFSEGVWNGDKYTEADLKEIVATFKATKEYLKPYLKLGHSEDQTLLAEDSLPAAGWIKNIYVKMTAVGAKLYADFVDMPEKIYELVKAGAYARVSSEIFMDVQVNGKTYGKALKAVALLGGETPAVQNLNDVYALYSVEPSVLAYADNADVRIYSFGAAQTQEDSMPLPQPPHPGAVPPHGAPPVGPALPPGHPGALPLGHPAAPAAAASPHALPAAAPIIPAEPDGDECYKQLAQAKQDLTGLQAQMAAIAPAQKALGEESASYKTANRSLALELEGAKQALAESRAEVVKFRSEAFAKEVKGTVEKWVNEKKIVPAQSAALEVLLTQAKESGSVKKFKLGDKELDSYEAIVQFVENGNGNGLPTKPQSENGVALTIDPDSGESVDSAVKKYMADNKTSSYTEAYKKVMAGLREQPKK